MENQVKQKSGFGVAALVLGIIGMVLAFIPIINTVSYILGALALIFGIIAIVKSAKKAMPIIATVLAVACLVTTSVMKVTVAAGVAKVVSDSANELSSELSDISGDNTEKLLGKSVNVTLGKFTVDKGEFITETKLVVTVENLEKETKSFSIQIEAVNPDGSRINTDYVYANNLGAGQKQNFETFTLVPSDEIAKYQAATFKVVEVSMF